MFVSNRFVYLELHKTGCTHTRNILNELLTGELVGKHNQASPDLFDGDRIFLGSVRDPWIWYTSLWAYGCDNKGAIFDNVTSRHTPIRGLGWKSNPYAAFLKLLANRSSNPQAWKDTYENINDARAFRKWLQMMNDEKYITDIGGGYAACPVSRVAGLMTFRYLRLFCTKSNEENKLNNLTTIERVKRFEQENCFIDQFIKNETLEADLFSALGKYGVKISEKAKSNVLSKPKTNTSSRKNGPEYYYDIKSANLVAQREQLIIEKFGYLAPNLEAST